MGIIKSIAIGVFVYLLLFFGDQGIHQIYFRLTHEYGSSNILMIKSSFMIAFASLLGGGIAGYLSQRGLLTGFMVGAIAGFIVLISQQVFLGSAPFTQEFTPAILFDGIFLKACISATAGATGQLLKSGYN